jgi:hypothetical protein
MTRLDASITTTVYPDRKQVARTGNLAVEPGLQQVEFSGPAALVLIGPGLRPRSAQARLLKLTGPARYFVETPTEQVHQLGELGSKRWKMSSA